MASWIGHADMSFIYPERTVNFKTNGGKETEFAEIVRKVIPPCHLNPLLFNGHVQTCWTAVNQAAPKTHYRRRVFQAENPAFVGSFAVDFVVDSKADKPDVSLPPRTTFFTDEEFKGIGSEDGKPMLVLLHGLSGGSHEVYLRHALEEVTNEGGWEACVINARGCARSQITSEVLFNARATWDVRQLVKWLRETFPNRPLFAVGFSLGANILTNYLGEEGDNSVIKAAVVCSNPWNLDVSNHVLQNSFLGLNVYSKVMGTNMKGLFEQHWEQIAKNPRIDIDAVRNSTYLYEFDRHVQGPTWGYPSEGAYYRDASSSDALLAVRTPLLAINATDDPIAVRAAIPFEEFKFNPYAVLCTTSLGGHLAWFETGGSRWFARAVGKFFKTMAKDIDLDSVQSVQSDDPVYKHAGNGSPEFHPMRRKLQLAI
ncbi:AB-hydrolase YheT [Eremomyces bilateralis CBS 781.70]|uniref:alcohol O-acetyltransferase n=1 Tax=Eremomyces bilateralis CBS 781.70 TaxID=1392243 RepID=A0A6G1G9B4_9PEZI|nr:AB-hydrolase YheT [Eremomyces bilateralis CBS 781.70]KAF1814459.1 AB-hydrolase YheT [Eremomyces bilateralis CBS 781.70]